MKTTKTLLLILSGMALASCGGISQNISSTPSSESEPISTTSIEPSSEPTSQSEESTEESNISISEETIEETTSLEPEESSEPEETSQTSTETSESKEIAILRWEKVSEEDDLLAGDEITIAVASKGLQIGEIAYDKNQYGYLAPMETTFQDDAIDAGDVGLTFTLENGENGSFLLNSAYGYLAATSKKLSFGDEGEKQWYISFEDGHASISSINSSLGSIYYNDSTPDRFTTYTKFSSKMKHIEVYRGLRAEAIYPSAINLSGEAEMKIGDSQNISFSFLPESANMRKIFFSSSDESVLSIEGKGKITAKKQGKATITAKAYSSEGVLDVISTFDIEVTPIYVTGISLNETSKEIGLGKKFTLKSVVSPSNATNKDIIWETSDPSILEVDNGVVTGVGIGSATITAKTVDGGFTATCEVSVSEIVLDSWTIMVYMCGSNLESSLTGYGSSVYGLATSDITELLKVKGQPEDVNIIIETGGASAWASTYGISSRKLGRYEVHDGNLVQVDSLSNASMGKQSTFTDFLNWGLENYPADRTGVILWNHGGAMMGCCSDENFGGDMLTPLEVERAFASAFETNNIAGKLEFVGYDACLMQVADIAELNSPYFNYMVGAQESETGTGWVYDKWVDDLYEGDDTVTILEEMCDTFVDDFETSNAGYANDQTLSVLDLSYAEAYKDAVEEYALEMGETIKDNKKTFASLAKKAKCFADYPMDSSEYYVYVNYYGYDSSYFEKVTEGRQTYYILKGWVEYGTFDALDLFKKLSASELFASPLIDNIIAAMEDLVIYSRAGDEAGEAYGLTQIANIGGFVSETYTKNCGSHFTNWLDIFANPF